MKRNTFVNTFVLETIAALVVIAPLFLGASVRAENPAHVKRLLDTGACVRCDLSGVVLKENHLIGVDLRGANLRGAKLQGSVLEGADLTGADLTGADLTGANLSGATLALVNLTGVNFTNAKLIHADVAGAIVKDLNLAGAQIHGTGLSIGGE
jgi:uncharacterized protein YjbI with pentapeptide repeats